MCHTTRARAISHMVSLSHVLAASALSASVGLTISDRFRWVHNNLEDPVGIHGPAGLWGSHGASAPAPKALGCATGFCSNCAPWPTLLIRGLHAKAPSKHWSHFQPFGSVSFSKSLLPQMKSETMPALDAVHNYLIHSEASSTSSWTHLL